MNEDLKNRIIKTYTVLKKHITKLNTKVNFRKIILFNFILFICSIGWFIFNEGLKFEMILFFLGGFIISMTPFLFMSMIFNHVRYNYAVKRSNFLIISFSIYTILNLYVFSFISYIQLDHIFVNKNYYTNISKVKGVFSDGFENLDLKSAYHALNYHYGRNNYEIDSYYEFEKNNEKFFMFHYFLENDIKKNALIKVFNEEVLEFNVGIPEKGYEDFIKNTRAFGKKADSLYNLHKTLDSLNPKDLKFIEEFSDLDKENKRNGIHISF